MTSSLDSGAIRLDGCPSGASKARQVHANLDNCVQHQAAPKFRKMQSSGSLQAMQSLP